MKKLWNLTGSVRLTFWLLLIISLTLAGGSYSIRFSPQIFKPLNTGFLQDWYRNYGQENLSAVWWVILLLALLGMLSINTAVCVINRLSALWKTRKQMTAFVLYHRITPSLAHICFFVMLIGHFLSLTTGVHQSIPLYPGSSFSLTGEINGEIIDHSCERYSEPAIIRGFLKQCSVTLKLRDKETLVKQINFLDTFSRHGFAFHLGMDKKSASPNLKLSVKRDPGVPLIVSGFTVLILLMMCYYLLMGRANK
ncbi:MAG: hypothetical protein RDU01_00865 [Thermodesulfovibrionales bacterium]|nr:hypothetical protein [Thermodesulfovibrionales bacterium]